MDVHRKEFQGSRTRVQHGFLLSAVLAMIGLVSLFAAGPSVPDAELAGGAALVLSAGVLIAVLRSARDHRPRMVLVGAGIWYRDWEIGTVSWVAIDDVYTGGSRLQTFITLRLRDPAGFVAALPEAERAKLKGNRLYRSPELRIPHGALDAPMADILGALRAGFEAAHEPAGPREGYGNPPTGSGKGGGGRLRVH